LSAKEFAFSAYAGIKRPSFERLMTPPAGSMREILMGGADKNQRCTAAAAGPSPLDSLLKLPQLPLFFGVGKSRQQAATGHLNINIPESQKKLSGEVLR
jgi:hypothetical protein